MLQNKINLKGLQTQCDIMDFTWILIFRKLQLQKKMLKRLVKSKRELKVG